jgi:hypothetical protein
MPFINGKFYMNPAYGRAVEDARAMESTASEADRQQQDSGAHNRWTPCADAGNA